MPGILIAAAALLAAPATATPPELDANRWAELAGLARALNALPLVRDEDRFGRPEHWQEADAAGGDCEDMALLARARLRALGWPPAALRLALAWTEAREYHAVLTVDVVRHGRPATYVLDNRFAWALPWDALTRHGYRWDRRERAGGTGWSYVARP